MPRTLQLGLSLNGEAVELSCAGYKTLLEVLREDLGLTGTKHGCELGECGACAVLIDGMPQLSCLVLAAECGGRAVETVEGLSRGAELHPLQAAFADLGAAQCGYCTPGILMTAKALLDRERMPDRERIKEAISGNLCRCTVTQDEYPLAPEHVRYVGDPVAAVVAKDEQTATQALDLIQVRYRVLDTISNPEEALAKPEPRIHAYSERGNIHRLQAFEFGSVEEAFAGSDHVFEDLFFYEGNTHLPIEQHAALAALDGEGKLTLWSSTQVPHYVHRCLARVLRVPASQIRVIACPNGGGFGGKCDVCNHEMVVAKAAMLLGRPVKICLNREEVFYMHRGRHPVLMKMRTGVTRDGKLTGMHVQTLVDGGGYGSYGVASTFYTGALQTVTYELPRYKFDAARVFTNKPPCGPKRGHGTPQPRFGQEVQLDKIAEKLGMDPAELRLGIVAKPDSLTANWLKIGSIGLAECIRQVVARSDWNSKFKKLPYGRGVGIACGSYLCGAGLPIYWNKMPQCGVQLLLDRSGQVTVFCGATEIGQGSDDVLVAMVAEVLGVDPFDVRCVTGDTGITPVDLGSYSSRVTVMMGNAAIQASQKLKDLIATAAAEQLEVAPDRLMFSNGKVFFEGRSLSFAEAVGFAEEKFGTLGAVGSYKPPRSPGRYKGAGVGPSPAYSYTACVVETEVDPRTGWITVPKKIGRAHV